MASSLAGAAHFGGLFLLLLAAALCPPLCGTHQAPVGLGDKGWWLWLGRECAYGRGLSRRRGGGRRGRRKEESTQSNHPPTWQGEQQEREKERPAKLLRFLPFGWCWVFPLHFTFFFSSILSCWWVLLSLWPAWPAALHHIISTHLPNHPFYFLTTSTSTIKDSSNRRPIRLRAA